MMSAHARQFWVVGILFSSAIDILTTYFLLRDNMFFVFYEGSPIFAPLIKMFGSGIALFVIAPLFILIFIELTLYLCDKFWPRGNSRGIRLQIVGCYSFMFTLLGIKICVAAANTVSLLKVREII